MTLISTDDQMAGNRNSGEDYMSVSTGCHDGHVVLQPKAGGLSGTQLILRRGLVVFAAVGLLAAGASVHFLVPLPETPPSEANFTLDVNTTNTPPDHTFFTT